MSESSSDDISWKDEVLKERIVNSSQSSASGSHLRSVKFSPLRLDSSLGDNEDGVLESLFQFGDQLSVNFLDELKAWDGDGDNNDVLSLFALNGGLKFLGSGDEEFLNISLEVAGSIFNIVEGLSDGSLELSGVGLFKG